MCPRLLHTSALNITHLEGKCLDARLQSGMHVLRSLSDTTCGSAVRFKCIRGSKLHATNATTLVLSIKEKKKTKSILRNGDSRKIDHRPDELFQLKGDLLYYFLQDVI